MPWRIALGRMDRSGFWGLKSFSNSTVYISRLTLIFIIIQGNLFLTRVSSEQKFSVISSDLSSLLYHPTRRVQP